MTSAKSNNLKYIAEWMGDNLLFSDYLESDKRKPVITFQLPDSFAKLFMNGGKEDVFGLVLPSVEFWFALVVVLIIWVYISSVLSFIMYKFIIQPQQQYHQRKNNKNNSKKHDDYYDDNGKNDGKTKTNLKTPYLIGFGILMPFCALFPFYEVYYFNIQNKVLRFVCTLGPITAFFRTSEAMFGFMPKYTGDSLKNTIVYNSIPVEVRFNILGPLKSSWEDVRGYLVKFGKFMVILGGYSSVMSAYNYVPFASDVGTDFADVLRGLFSLRQWGNNALATVLFQLYLTTFGHGITTITSICGVQQIPTMLNPVFESTSPSDFWGRRWNLVVHGILKRGIYKPFRSRFSRLVASMATFIASGIFHEWLLYVLFSPEHTQFEGDSCTPPQCYRPGLGRSTLFFIWNAIIIAMEYAIGGALIFQLMKKHLPSVVVSILVTSTALPMVHWFTNDYVRSDYFKDGQIGFPMVVRIDN